MKGNKKELYKSRLRNEQFASRVRTTLWLETPSPSNPYIAEQAHCHGYDIFELISKRSFIDVLFLLFRGELPTHDQARILESLMIGLINPGPRHPATRAAMNTGVGKTDTAHILPIAQLTLGGSYLGGNEVSQAMRFLNKSARKDPREVIEDLLSKHKRTDEGDWHIAPGFGTRFGTVDVLPMRLATVIAQMPGTGNIWKWAAEFTDILRAKEECGWLSSGIAAAVLADLGFHPRSGAGMFQLISAPGLLAHGLEMSNKPLTAMPFIDDDHYVIE